MHRSKIPDALRTLIREGRLLLQTAYTPTVPGYGQLLVEPAQQVATERSAEWSTSTMILLRSIFGQKSELYERAAPYAAQAFMLGNVKQLIGIVRAALFAWENDYVFSIEEQVEEQVETTLLDQAQLSFRKQEAWGHRYLLAQLSSSTFAPCAPNTALSWSIQAATVEHWAHLTKNSMARAHIARPITSTLRCL